MDHPRILKIRAAATPAGGGAYAGHGIGRSRRRSCCGGSTGRVSRARRLHHEHQEQRVVGVEEHLLEGLMAQERLSAGSAPVAPGTVLRERPPETGLSAMRVARIIVPRAVN